MASQQRGLAPQSAPTRPRETSGYALAGGRPRLRSPQIAPARRVTEQARLCRDELGRRWRQKSAQIGFVVAILFDGGVGVEHARLVGVSAGVKPTLDGGVLMEELQNDEGACRPLSF